MADRDQRRALSRFYRRRRRQRARARPSLPDRCAERAGTQAVARLEPVPDSRGGAAGGAACAPPPSPTSSSSAIPVPRRWNARSRSRANTSSPAAGPSVTASLPSKAPSTGVRSRRSPPAARKNTSKASARWCGASIRFRSATSRRSKRAIGPETAAILIEPIQGEGGVRVVPTPFLRGLRELCDEHELLLVFDEVQTGMGRTGSFFAHQRCGVTPDVMGIAKALGGGFPVGACLTTAEAGKGMTAGTHGSTFGANPLAMAVGNAVLDLVLAPEFLEKVQPQRDPVSPAPRRDQGSPSRRHLRGARRRPAARARRACARTASWSRRCVPRSFSPSRPETMWCACCRR